jgi:orotidine-5'-phosphate decarboxylase
VNALRGARPDDLLVPVSRGLLRTEDRSISLSDYQMLIKKRLEQLKATISSFAKQSLPLLLSE